MAEIPEEILRRSAEAKARATGRDVEEILAEMKGEKAPVAAAAEDAPVTPTSDETSPADDSLKAKAQTAAAALPPHLLRRSAEARAKALGVPVEQVIAEMTGAAAQAAETPAPATDEPAPAEATPPPDTDGTPPPEAPPAGPLPEKLLIRSAEAKAKATGRPVDEIIAELRSMAPPPPPPETPAAPAAAPPPTEASAPAPEATPPVAPPAGPLSEKLLIRSAEAKAKATGRPVDEIIAELRSMAPPPPPPGPAKAAAAATEAPAPVSETAPAAATTAAKVPGKLLRRSAEAKAKATGRPVEEILAELMGEADTAAPPPAAAAPAAAAPDPAKAAAAAAIPEHLLRRSAEARAKATGGSAEQILAEWMGATTAATAPAAAAPVAPAAAAPDPVRAAAAPAIPEHLLRRSAEARAKATGGSAEQILAEWMDATTAATAPSAAPAAAAPADIVPAPAPAEAAAETTTEHVPEHLLRRSAEARAKATGRPVDEILAELMDETATAPTPAAGTPIPAAATPAAAEAASPPAQEHTGTGPQPAAVKPEAFRSAGPKPMGSINVRPHLLAIESAALLVVMALLAVFWVLRDVPLLELINLNNQPAPCKGLIVGFASITVLLGSLFLIHYTKLGRRPVFLLTGSALFGFLAIVGLMYSLYAPGGLRPESVEGLNALQLRILPGVLMLGSLTLFAIFVSALSRLDSKQD